MFDKIEAFLTKEVVDGVQVWYVLAVVAALAAIVAVVN